MFNPLKNPKQLFLLDGIGAIVSSFFLGFVLVQLKEWIGIPTNILYILAGMAIIFAVYSLSCYALVRKNEWKFLAVIAIINLLYSCLTFGLLIYFVHQLTILDWVYFLLEIIVLAVLVSIEFKVFLGLKRNEY